MPRSRKPSQVQTGISVRDQEQDAIFEDEVRRIARALWPAAEFHGAAKYGERERDGVFDTDDCIHIVEATTSRAMRKAEIDGEKLASMVERIQKKNPTKAAKGWFVTRDEPTADQRSHLRRYGNTVNCLSFAQFQSRLIDARGYLSARADYAFGSVRDPESGDLEPRVAYVPLELKELKGERLFSVGDVVNGLRQGTSYVLLGDFGSGKSMTLREVYLSLRKDHLRDRTSSFPVFLNLRDHWGQSDPAEVLERHARSIGFSPASSLVRAWRAGYVILLIDGFDELTALGFQGLWKKLTDVRFRALEATRRLVKEHPSATGLVVTGRAHFFNSDTERRTALGTTLATVELSLSDFTTEQIKEYLESAGLGKQVPEWLPSRPLLVGYLASRGLLAHLLTADGLALTPAEGWNELLSLICERESQIEAGIDGPTVRRILERLATFARSRASGLGPLETSDLVEAFKQVCGYAPEERGMVLLQRLPGIGIDQPGEDSRSFIHEDLADGCRAGDLVAFLEDPYGFESSHWQGLDMLVNDIGVQIASNTVREWPKRDPRLDTALRRAQETLESSFVAADVLRVMLDIGANISSQVTIRDIILPELSLDAESPDLSGVRFVECIFRHLSIDINLPVEAAPRLERCFIAELEAGDPRASTDSVPFLVDCDIDQVSATVHTTASILILDLPLGSRVLLTVLKKLYHQRGSGRKANALHRGLDHHAKRLVPDVMAVLQREGLAVEVRRPGYTLWLPERSQLRRVSRILANPNGSNDPLLRQCSDLR